jgi:hypothetical protein
VTANVVRLIDSIFNRQLDPFRSLARDGSLADVNVSYHGTFLIAVNGTGAVYLSVSERVGPFRRRTQQQPAFSFGSP